MTPSHEAHIGAFYFPLTLSLLLYSNSDRECKPIIKNIVAKMGQPCTCSQKPDK